MPDYIVLDEADTIVDCLVKNLNKTFINSWKDLENYNVNTPLIFRGMTQRKTESVCRTQGRDYYYIDTGYIGNMQKRKDWHRIVKNGMQHGDPIYNMPCDRFNFIAEQKLYLRFPGWKKTGRSILLVTPSEKPCAFYGIDREQWVNDTIEKLKQHTDRPIIIRDKALRRDRVGKNNIYNQIDEDNVFAVVTYNSIAATEAIGYGIPAFTLAPNAADPFCLKDLSKIESPLYEDEAKVIKWQHWLGYCQYTPAEMSNGTAMRLIKEYNLK